MKVVRLDKLQFIPASHEDPADPGSLKKVIFKRNDLMAGRIQMINWAKIPKGKAFSSYYHEDMEEVFILLNGKIRIVIEDEESILERGDTVIVPIGAVHVMENIGNEDVEYIVIGTTLGRGGKTILI